MSSTRFGVNLHSLVAWMSRNSLLETGTISWSLSDSNGILTHKHLVRKRTLNHYTNHIAAWMSIAYRFTVKHVRDMIVTYNQMHRTDEYSQHRQFNHLASLANWLSVRLRTKQLWVRIPLLSLKLQKSRLFRAKSYLTFRQL